MDAKMAKKEWEQIITDHMKVDSNKYLTAEQQEEMESEFYDFINQYNK